MMAPYVIDKLDHIYIQYTYIVRKYKNYLYKFYKQEVKQLSGKLLTPVCFLLLFWQEYKQDELWANAHLLYPRSSANRK